MKEYDYKKIISNYEKIIKKQAKERKELEELIKALKEKIIDLEQKLSKDSNNSHKPPRSNKFGKRHRNKNKKSNKKPGGQPKHTGKTLKIKEADEMKIHLPHNCSQCNKNLDNEPFVSVNEKFRQEIKIIIKKVRVNHHIGSKICPFCKTESKGNYPYGINSNIQYSNDIKSLSTYLFHYQLIPYRRIAHFFESLLGIKLSPGTVYNFNEKFSKLSETTYKEMKKMIINSDLIHADETGIKVNGSNYYCYVFSNKKVTYLDIHKSRSKKALDSFDILSNFNGNLISDFYPIYRQYQNLTNYFCNAHLLRDLTFIHEVEKREWAAEMIELLLRMKMFSHLYDETDEEEQTQKLYLKIEFENLLDKALKEEEPFLKIKSNSRKQSKSKNIIDRLKEFKEGYLGFFNYKEIPFTNNQGETDFRMEKVKQNISGTFRTEKDAKKFTKGFAIISTIIKQDISILESIKQIFQGNHLIFDT